MRTKEHYVFISKWLWNSIPAWNKYETFGCFFYMYVHWSKKNNLFDWWNQNKCVVYMEFVVEFSNYVVNEKQINKLW